MNKDEREVYVRKEVLTILDQCANYLVPERAIANQARIAVTPPPTQAELDSALGFLDGKRWATAVQPDGGGPRKWMITDAGRAALSQM